MKTHILRRSQARVNTNCTLPHFVTGLKYFTQASLLKVSLLLISLFATDTFNLSKEKNEVKERTPFFNYSFWFHSKRNLYSLQVIVIKKNFWFLQSVDFSWVNVSMKKALFPFYCTLNLSSEISEMTKALCLYEELGRILRYCRA